jgi:hypothetical protein
MQLAASLADRDLVFQDRFFLPAGLRPALPCF